MWQCVLGLNDNIKIIYNLLNRFLAKAAIHKIEKELIFHYRIMQRLVLSSLSNSGEYLNKVLFLSAS